MDIDQKGRQLALRAVHLIEDIIIAAKRECGGAALSHPFEQLVGKP